jgi:glyoxylase-like metal-dependent hydrolase (beta-lactamase superfamily II)
MKEIARDVAIVPTIIANAYLIGNSRSWVLVDSCTPGNHRRILRAAEARFGPGAKPRAILLTHGHFDHAGSAARLADLWAVPILAHRLELPYLTGRAHYPPLDPTGPGFFSALSRVFPSSTVNLGDRVQAIEPGGPLPGLEEWESLFTPGHTPGHLAFFRPGDRVLVAGDALTTMDLDSFWGTILKRPRMCRPPKPATTNWEKARASVQHLAALHPHTVAAGHGTPMHDAASELQELADHFPIPERGRYVTQPAW